MNEDWSDKYKKSIDCNNPKGFSQRAHCQGRKKNESKTIKVDHTAIMDSVKAGYILVQDRKCIARGNKKEMLELHDQTPNSRVWVSSAEVGQLVEEENPRKMYHKHFMKAMKAMPGSQIQAKHKAEMEKYRKQMGSSFINQVAPKKMSKFDKKIKEDAPTVNTGGGQVAGLGVGDQGEPGIKKRKRYQKGELLPFYAFVRRKTK